MTAVRSSREFDDYWNEFRDIEQSKAQDELTDEDASKTPDEGEQELAWLREAGFKGLATKYEEGNELEDHVLLQATQSLTRSQAAAVKKRVDTLNATLKKRQFNYADMRELFVEKGQQPSDQDGTQRHSKRTHVKKRSLKRGHQYSMTGEVEEAEGGALTQDHPGIETLSIQSRASPMHIITQQEEEPEEETGERLSRTVSDSEVKLNFKTDDSSDVTSDSSLNFSNDSVTEESEGMPNYVLVQDELGVTKIDDVGPEDKEKIRALAYIELTALFDIYNILFTPIKSKVKGQQPSDQDGTQRHSKRTHVKKRSLKRGHQYSMTGEVEEAEGGALTQDHPGIETLSIQSRASPMHIITQQEEEPEEETGERLSRTVSDSEVKLNFKTDDSSDVTSDSSLNFSNDSVTEESEGMPNYVLVQDELGVTKIDDVGPEDKEKIRALAYIELTALFDIYNILFTPIKSKVKIKEQGLFGVPLHTLQHEDRGQHVGVPLIFKQIISFLEKNALEMEGILRVPGSAARIRNLRQQIEDTFPSGEFSWNDVRPNDAAALLKQFLRELPEPLLTNQCTDAFAQVQAISDKKQQLQALNLLILLLPDVNRSTLKLLLQFLHHVIDHKQQNKMSLANVAMIMAPNLFLVQSHYKHKDLKELETQRAASMSNIVKMLIRYHHILWTVPSVMLMQVRHQYEMEQQKKTKDKSIMQLFGGKKDKSEVYKKISSEAEFKEGIIRVQAPGLTKNSTAVQLDENMTAGEIVAKFKRKTSYDVTPQRSSKGAVYAPPRGCANPMNVTFAMDNSYLYECGGNIGERRLDNNANMLALYKVNPNAEWIIKDIPVSRMQ
ncbi:rho GTPase-activating protein 18-like [Lingula anatina]|uniref:Rho GTPase-activating protein 18-like n=1 Tax=Lingula anatina TaxID=7574 RepID=A0A1S3KEL1_LINAN|nr:rho GTPase-activating protein 18-like [Lingula anatina]|eukprot:XP_013420894.1 rho GTPase-activating protein 18-like [Lingula anatina]